MKRLLIPLTTFIFIVNLVGALADRVDSEVMMARKKTGKIIRVSPKGDAKKGGYPGTVTIEEAAKRARPGVILELLPGYYDHIHFTRIRPDNIVVQGDGSGKFCDIRLVFEGQGCVVRNIFCRAVEGDRVTFVDSKFHHLILTNGKGKPRPVVYNCAFNAATLFANRSDISIKNCTILRMFYRGKARSDFRYNAGVWRYGGHAMIHFGKMEKRGEVEFNRCILQTNEFVFDPDHGKNSTKEIRMKFEDNLVHADMGLVKVGEKAKKIKDFDGLDEYFDARERENKMAKVEFLATPDVQKNRHHWDLDRKYFEIRGKYQGKGYGCNMGPKGIPVPFKQK